ncbi:MAG: hypothetical protein KDD53_02165 [Bdellovibrionales bacterium]|nr:hypothetical protein [Bdellovibrionales bacterium]
MSYFNIKQCVLLLVALGIGATSVCADELALPLKVIEPGLTSSHVESTSVGCLDCHTQTDSASMHENPAVSIGCADCHGGDASVRASGLAKQDSRYESLKRQAHVLPDEPERWPTSANPKGSYTDILHESVEFVRFVNPGDLRVAAETCGGCHAKIVRAVQKSLMTTTAMLFGGASYNNNILPYKQYVLGESYGRDGKAQSLEDTSELSDELKARGALKKLVPLPQWEVVAPGDNFRVFESGGLFVKSQFPEIGLPNPLEEPGKPDVLQSNRGVATGSRISVPVLNIHKTRLNDPHLSLLGTNEHPGDYRSSGCTACHSIYANDRDERHSGPYAKFGHEGKTQTKDPTIPKGEEGHPLKHVFSRAIPTSQCMVCHMHQPNMFVNSFLGYTMWDYESDAPSMWPEKQKHPTDEEKWKSFDHNPEEAAAHGKWTDIEFLKKVSELNPNLKNTQFADYHGHGWNFRAVAKKDRKGHLLDEDGKIISPEDPEKFKKAVHMSDIHLDKGMHCVDCHFAQDSHGDGHIYGEVAQAVQVRCKDCHGTVKERATLKTSGPAASDGGEDLELQRTPFGKPRFQWEGDSLYQYSSLYPDLRWEVKQVRDIVTPGSRFYNEKAARAKLTKRLDPESTSPTVASLSEVDKEKNSTKLLAHAEDSFACFTCHSSWVTSCAGCHLPIQANWKQRSKHYDGKTTRNWATYNPQVVRDQMFQIGKHGPAKGGIIAPIRSSSALVLSSTDINRQKIYVQQPPIAASGHSSQAFAPHFPHTVRTKETKQCEDCHVSEANDNNAIMAQLLLFGTNFVNFMGYHAYVATGEEGLEAIQVTEWDEPQAVIGSYLQRYAYPDWYAKHQELKQELQESHAHHGVGGVTNTIQLRGEYLYTTAGEGGFRVYDVANIANKGFSERIVTAPFSPLGQDTHVSSKNATSFALPTNMPVAPFRKALPENLEDPLHEIYHYVVITDSVEGLILVNVDTLADRDRTNNFLSRAVTWNDNGILTGAKKITLAGTNAFVAVPDGVVELSLDTPLEPKFIAKIPFNDPRATAVQFRYLFVTDADGFHVVDVTKPEAPRIVSEASLALKDAHQLYLARTYAYVAGGREGLVIIDIEKPEAPTIYMRYDENQTINDLRDVKVASTNASLFAYLADGKNGFKVLQLTDPERVPTYYGFSPEVKPKLIAWKATHGPALAISKGLDRDRAVDETGHQVSILGRIGSRPFYLDEMKKLYLNQAGRLFTVKND